MDCGGSHRTPRSYTVVVLCSDYRLRVILCHVDVEDNVKPLHEINRMALLENCTLILAWSSQEAARSVPSPHSPTYVRTGSHRDSRSVFIVRVHHSIEPAVSRSSHLLFPTGVLIAYAVDGGVQVPNQAHPYSQAR